ncbi:hypothetical protein F751_6629 [Auxenochlorella protothecoides]|uniref:GOLD domain-containing protein n=1 Tax=Auxenochlorella protothecoides TaxID=3075 RepID=A0A087SLR8_AUXPR|nr:hypothetical protein F751_6629 [Auxenochlorella protothecoides]KFM26672.1 hypothetical protein F751_6629 [Auxenochlorella protothecoides]RMZ54064.1 hypothetical protein APUTEX25_002641 [Auxenochlorella protothecoides]|eukprot:RMZ54064.1 hypothetical protein APUTEX25_002641 [Auxenochlorella protothecoides]
MAPTAALLATLLALSAVVLGADGLSWRLFAGREECISEYIPEHQWDAVKSHATDVSLAQGIVDIGVLISSRYGTEATKATVDFTLYDPAGRIIHSEVAVSSAEATVTGHGGQGPWRACFKVSRQQILRPSVIVRLSYFTVNSPTLVGTHFEWQRTPPEAGGIQLSPGGVTAGELGTNDQVQSLADGLQRLDYYLHNVTNEQRYLSSRTERHLQTVRSTHSRALWYYVALYGVIVAASFAQVVGVRVMFSNRRKQGIII